MLLGGKRVEGNWVFDSEEEGDWEKGSERQARVKLREARFEKRNAR
jgi:hypothetical protein